MRERKIKVIVILGQTATGKSNLAVKVARKVNGEIISADSRQIYKRLNIGTGKISKKEMQGVPHYMLNVADPREQFSVALFQKKAISIMAEIISRGKTPIIVGGTGFYVDSITKGLVLPEVPPNEKLRKSLGRKSTGTLFNMLKKLDKARAKSIDPKNKVRLIRAIEIVKHLGRVPKIKTNPPPYEFIKIGLYLPSVKLKGKIETRVKKMFKDGLPGEIRKLKKAGVSNRRLKELGFEYWQPTEESVIKQSLNYAKRQMTWFKRDKEITWYDSSSLKNLAALVKAIPKLLRE